MLAQGSYVLTEPNLDDNVKVIDGIEVTGDIIGNIVCRVVQNNAPGERVTVH